MEDSLPDELALDDIDGVNMSHSTGRDGEMSAR